MRMVVGVWHDFSATSPTLTNLFEDPTSVVPTLYLRQNLQQKKWTPLYDRSWNLSGRSFTGTDPINTVRNFQINLRGKRLPKKEITYNSSGNPDHCYFFVLWSSWVAGGSAPDFDMDYRITYTDC